MTALECGRNQNQSCFFVTDVVLWQRFKGSWMNDTTDKPPETSDKVEGLAEKHCLDTKELDKAVDSYNAAMKGEQFHLMKLDGKYTTALSQTGPIGPILSAMHRFMAIR